MKIGIVGTGNMGSILIHALIEGKAVREADLLATNRTISKAKELNTIYPAMTVLEDIHRLAADSNVLFICVKPLEIEPLLRNIKSDLSADQLLITITSPVSVRQLESKVPCKVARVIPSITNRALDGATLITFGDRCGEREKTTVMALAKKISTPIVIDETITRVASDLSSCGPAFIGYILERMIGAAVSETDISRGQATELATAMMIGMGKLLEKNIFSLETLRKKVQVKGGVTGVGLEVLEAEIGDVFHHLFQKTQEKFLEDHREVDRQFADNKS
ncbi:late competence protein ComER [Camelliibacillus cellulosilyticus]|uniref:Pyrroline-5-carboxylate reductase n=1 Tax=Camelliibacillus cellulosilyticus TaxID=2174486 RepID=A0ABV9GLL7_9BACL